jgi:succinoglycan biosynthesis protein ExoM
MRVRVCVPTHRRPALLGRTLESLGAQRFSRVAPPELGIIVVDNDAACEGRAVVETARAVCPWPIEYLTETRPGISHARNRLVAAADGADWIAMIDDDEVAEPGWLDALLAAAAATGADAVLGPVEPVFEVEPPDWMRPFFSRRRPATGAAIDANDFRTGNVLLSPAALRRVEGPFDPAFALTGGEDSFLGRQLEAAGARFTWADDAVVRERQPAERTRARWILERRYRSGATLSAIRIRMMGRLSAGPLVVFRTAGLLARGNARIATALVGGRPRLFAGVADLAYGAGSLAGLAGVALKAYGDRRGR